jgi:hypothetical protein
MAASALLAALEVLYASELSVGKVLVVEALLGS